MIDTKELTVVLTSMEHDETSPACDICFEVSRKALTWTYVRRHILSSCFYF